MAACIGCIKLLNFLAKKFLLTDADERQYLTSLGNTSLYIIGTLTNHSKTILKNLKLCHSLI